MCIQESKLSMICNSTTNEILGPAFGYDFLPAMNVSSGILLDWNTDAWAVSDVTKGRYSLSAKLSEARAQANQWWITVVYGPQLDSEKVEFLDELR